MPGPTQYGGVPVTNIRNVSSPHWRGWLSPKNRCIVPATAFCEYADGKPRKIPTWFALDEHRRLFAFAGLWTPWRGVRGPKSAPVEGEHELFDFLTTEPNSIVAPIHPKAMPVILTTPEEVDLWLSGETPDALKLQRPLPDELLRIVARGQKEDPPPVFRIPGGDRTVVLGVHRDLESHPTKAMKSSKPQKPDTAELKKLARVFLEPYVAAEPSTDEELHQLFIEGGFSSFEGGTVKLTEGLGEASSSLVEKAAKLFGPKGAQEKALADIAEK
jgi:hypothetical protein